MVRIVKTLSALAPKTLTDIAHFTLGIFVTQLHKALDPVWATAMAFAVTTTYIIYQLLEPESAKEDLREFLGGLLAGLGYSYISPF